MNKLTGRALRHVRIRKKILGTNERPRMVVYRSLNNLYVQLIDDISHKTLFSISTNTPEIHKEVGHGGNVKAATLLGTHLAKRLLERGISHVVFDRGGYMYHGRVKALAEAVLKGGLSFRRKGAKIRKPKKEEPKIEKPDVKKQEPKIKKEETKVNKEEASVKKQEDNGIDRK